MSKKSFKKSLIRDGGGHGFEGFSTQKHKKVTKKSDSEGQTSLKSHFTVG